MHIAGLQRTTLVDYPGKVAATVFTRGCSFSCPFCHNPELVLPAKFIPLLDEKEIWAFFDKRLHQLQGVCFTGGEPTIQSDLPLFVAKLKSFGYKIKLDTNGSNPAMLGRLIDSGHIDYIAMDIKASPSKYLATAGVKNPSVSTRPSLDGNIKNQNDNSKLLNNIKQSIGLIMESGIDYEFRTTVVHPIHEVSDFEEIGKLIRGAKKYYLQNFVQSKHIDESQKFTPLSDKELKDIKTIIKKYIDQVQIR